MELKILFVEDHDDTRNMLARMMGRWGHTVRAAGTVAAAKLLAAQELFDIILCDLGLPDGSGNDVLSAIDRPVHAVALTGYGDECTIQAAKEAGFCRYLQKPLILTELQSLLTEFVAEKRAAGGGPGDVAR